MMMVVQRAYDYDVKAVRSLMRESGAPDWYLWTYDHATIPIDTKTGKGFERNCEHDKTARCNIRSRY